MFLPLAPTSQCSPSSLHVLSSPTTGVTHAGQSVTFTGLGGMQYRRVSVIGRDIGVNTLEAATRLWSQVQRATQTQAPAALETVTLALGAACTAVLCACDAGLKSSLSLPSHGELYIDRSETAQSELRVLSGWSDVILINPLILWPITAVVR